MKLPVWETPAEPVITFESNVPVTLEVIWGEGENKKSVAFALTYRHDEKTLTDEDVNKVQNAILEALESALDLTLRA